MKKTLIALVGITLLMAFVTACQMEVAEPEARLLLVEPYITAHPASKVVPTNFNVNDNPIVLNVEVAEWDPADGSLSYQWFTFSSLVAYLKGEAEPATDGEATTSADGMMSSFTLDAPSLTAGKKYYYYAEVTNTNGAATNKQSSTVKSDVAIISVYTAGGPVPPTITTQPADASYRFGRTLNPLSVIVADVPAPGKITYQWYRVQVDANGDPKDDGNGNLLSDPIEPNEIEVQTDPTTWADPPVPPDNPGTPEFETVIEYGTGVDDEYQPAPRDVALGKNYFYVVVTHTDAVDNTATETSAPATITIEPALRAEAPVINVQPIAALYFDTDTGPVAPLAVDAESMDLGDLSYQWYYNATGSNKSGALIAGATEETYTPNFSNNPDAFYYVVVTNTNDNVLGTKTATTNSRAVNVRRTAAAGTVAQNSTITVSNLNSTIFRYNYIRGYGGMEVAWANFPETMPDDTRLQYDPDQLGYNMLRIMMPVSNVNIDKAMEDLVINTKRRPHYYDNVKIVNEYGGYVAAAPWSPPKEWKSNNSINGGGILRPQYYGQYANYLKAFAQHMYNRGAPIYAISIQNEPNYTAGYDGCEWEGEDMKNFFKEVGAFTQGVRGWGGGKQIPRVLTMNGESANNPNINWPAIDDPQAYAAIDVFARHVYGERTQNLWSSRPNVQKRDGKEVWMTEHNINSANASGYYLDSSWDYIWRFMNDIDLVMRRNNENAFVWWASKRFYSMVGDGQYGTSDGAPLPRGWGLAHYSKYTIGMTRIGFSMTGQTVGGANISITPTAGSEGGSSVLNGTSGDTDNTSARVTVYVSDDKKEISLVMWTPTLQNGNIVHDLGTVKIDMPPDFTIASATAVRSRKLSATQNEFLVPQTVPVSADRTSAYVTLNGSQILSVKFTAQ